MEKEVKKNRLPIYIAVISAAIIIASIILGFFYFIGQVSKQTTIESQEQQKLIEMGQKKQEQAKRKLELESCLLAAGSSYYSGWLKECKSRSLLKGECLKMADTTFDRYAQQNSLPVDTLENKKESIYSFYEKKEKCACRLPVDTAERMDKGLVDAKDECYKKYPQ